MLLPHVHLSTVKKNFADQFTADGSGYVYRRLRRGPAIRVTTAERDRFVRVFDRGMTLMFWGGIVATIASLGVITVFPEVLPSRFRDDGQGGVIAILVIVFMAVWWRLSSHPSRVLERRVTIRDGLGAAEIRRQNLARLPWSTIALGGVVTTGLFVRIAIEPHPVRDHIGAILTGIVCMAVFALIGWLKYSAR